MLTRFRLSHITLSRPIVRGFTELIDVNSIPKWTPAKTPMEYIAAVAPIEIEAAVAICDGKHEGSGHPVQFLQLNRKVPHSIETCKYCGLRFKMKEGYVPSAH